jgi:hypothetical protein
MRVRGSLIILSHHVWFEAERSGSLLNVQPLHTDAPESEHATVLAHFAEVFAATFFAEQPPAVEPAAAATPEVRATGGPINADTSYLVGDDGPEIFLPGSNGSIMPNEDHKNTVV